MSVDSVFSQLCSLMASCLLPTFTDDAMSFIKPLKITDTHVIVDNPHLSAFGLVLDFLMGIWNKQVKGQVLLFLSPPNHAKQTQNINVLLLPRNIPMTEVKIHYSYSFIFFIVSIESSLVHSCVALYSLGVVATNNECEH